MKKIVVIIMLMSFLPFANAQTNDSIVNKTVTYAQEGNAVCQTMLGKWLFEGSHGYKKDYAKAVAWWMQAAIQDNDEAIANLGFCYQYGWGVEADSTTAVRLFEKSIKQGNTTLLSTHDSLANKGNVLSAMLLAKCYKKAIGVRRDEASAQKYYQLAAKQGNVEAMREAGILMRSAKDDVNALSMFKQAMEKGDVVSTYYYGKMLCEGRGIAKDAVAGVGCLQKAADQGYAAAQYELAEAYATGNGVEQNMSTAFAWYNKAAMGGNPTAWWQLAECYRQGRGTVVDYEMALDCYAKASSLGYHNKLRVLLTEDDSEWRDTPFMLYLRGMRLLEVDDNPDAAMKEFGKLPKQISARQTMKAICIMHPSYSKRNVKDAVKQLQKLAAAGDNRATYELALMQMRGEGMEKDVSKAEKTLSGLAKGGYARAMNYLADVYYEGRDLKQDKTKAILLYLQAEQQGLLSATGASRLEEAFSTGDGVKINQERAEELARYRACDIRSVLEKVKVK